MANLFGELLFGLTKLLFADLVETSLARFGYRFLVWLDPFVRGRWAKFFAGGFLGLAAYFLYPILMSLFS